jgi:hypothetical protein
MFSGALWGLIGKSGEKPARSRHCKSKTAVSKDHSVLSPGKGERLAAFFEARRPAENAVRLACGEQGECLQTFQTFLSFPPIPFTFRVCRPNFGIRAHGSVDELNASLEDSF